MHVKNSFIFKQEAQNRWENLSQRQNPIARSQVLEMSLSQKELRPENLILELTILVTDNFMLIKTKHMLISEWVKKKTKTSRAPVLQSGFQITSD